MQQANIFLYGSFAQYGSVLNRELYTIAADGGVINALRNGCTPACVVGDGDSIADLPEEYKKQASSVPFVHFPEQNSTDFEKSLRYLQDMKYTHVNVFCFQGDRLDHMLAGLSACLHFRNITIILYTGTQEIRHLPKRFSAASIPGETISLIPFPIAHAVTTHGLEWELSNSNLAFGNGISISNRALDKVIKITYTSGELFLIRPIKV